MLIHRQTFYAKSGCLDEAVRLLKEEAARIGRDARVQVAEFGPFDVVVLDLTFESLAAQEEFWTNWFATQGADAFFKQFDQLWAGPGKNEMWNVLEREDPLNNGKTVHLINRRTFHFKSGNLWPAVELMQDQQNRPDMPVNFRILTGSVGPYNQMVVDFEFTSHEEYFSEWEKWGQRDDTSTFFEAWTALIEPGGTNELWVVQ